MTGAPEPGITLALSASSGPCSCALRVPDGTVTGERSLPAHELVAAVARLVQSVGARPRDVAELRVDVGPGSYTGLRITLAFARTLQAFQPLPVLVATSFELLAAAAWAQGADRARTVRPVLDARRGRLHHAALRLDPDAHVARFVEPPTAVTREQLCNRIRDGDVVLAERSLHDQLAPVAAAATVLEARGYDARRLFDPLVAPRTAGAAELEPLYLMRSYAE